MWNSTKRFVFTVILSFHFYVTFCPDVSSSLFSVSNLVFFFANIKMQTEFSFGLEKSKSAKILINIQCFKEHGIADWVVWLVVQNICRGFVEVVKEVTIFHTWSRIISRITLFYVPERELISIECSLLETSLFNSKSNEIR